MKKAKAKRLSNRLRVGDTVHRTVSAPWDDEVPLDITGTVIMCQGKKFFKGNETNENDDFIDEIRKHNKIKVK